MDFCGGLQNARAIVPSIVQMQKLNYHDLHSDLKLLILVEGGCL